MQSCVLILLAFNTRMARQGRPNTLPLGKQKWLVDFGR